MLKAVDGARVWDTETNEPVGTLKTTDHGLILDIENLPGKRADQCDIAFRVTDEDTGRVYFAVRTQKGEELLFESDDPRGRGPDAYPC